MENMCNSYTVMSNKEINSYRHKAERRWYRRLIRINLLVIVFIVLMFIGSKEENKKYFENLQSDLYNVATEVMNEVENETTEPSDKTSPQIEEAYENTEYSDGDKELSDEISNYTVGYDDGYCAGYYDGASGTSYDESLASESTAMNRLMKRLENFPEDIKLLAMIMGVLIFLPVAVSYVYAKYRSMSIKVTEKNFPEIYEIVQEYTIRLGLKKVPNVYIIQGNGVLNAFASFIPFKQYIELYADLVEVAYREYNDLDSLRFIIGHEMAHIKLKHATLHYSLLILFANYIPILSSTASRAREYSCDRIAQHLSGSDGIDAMMTLTAGIHLYKRVDKEDYIENARKEKGFFVWCYNLVSNHPITTKRVLALEMKEGSGKLY